VGGSVEVACSSHADARFGVTFHSEGFCLFVRRVDVRCRPAGVDQGG
jgi:hypothetical protein